MLLQAISSLSWSIIVLLTLIQTLDVMTRLTNIWLVVKTFQRCLNRVLYCPYSPYIASVWLSLSFDSVFRLFQWLSLRLDVLFFINRRDYFAILDGASYNAIDTAPWFGLVCYWGVTGSQLASRACWPVCRFNIEDLGFGRATRHLKSSEGVLDGETIVCYFAKDHIACFLSSSVHRDMEFWILDGFRWVDSTRLQDPTIRQFSNIWSVSEWGHREAHC